MNRRTFLQSSAAIAAAPLVACAADKSRPASRELGKILDAPVLKTELLREPVKVASIELLQNGKVYLLRTRSTDGVEAITVPHPNWTTMTHPILLKAVRPAFVGQDARELEPAGAHPDLPVQRALSSLPFGLNQVG